MHEFENWPQVITAHVIFRMQFFFFRYKGLKDSFLAEEALITVVIPNLQHLHVKF